MIDNMLERGGGVGQPQQIIQPTLVLGLERWLLARFGLVLPFVTDCLDAWRLDEVVPLDK